MSAPDVTFWKVATGLTGTVNINAIGGSATQITGGSVFNFGAVEADMWSVPQILLVRFANNSAMNIDLKLYDTDADVSEPITTTTSENLFPSGWTDNSSSFWNFHIALKAAYVDPLTIDTNPATSEISSWLPLLHNTDHFRLDDPSTGHMPATGNDGRSTTNGSGIPKFLTENVSGDTTLHFTNFFIYIAGKPRSAAPAGDTAGWGIRMSYVYPFV